MIFEVGVDLNIDLESDVAFRFFLMACMIKS